MANREIRRKQKITSNQASTVEEVDLKGFIVVILGIAIVVVIAYGLTLLAKHAGLFDLRYIKPEIAAATIDYENISAGTIFNRIENEYYVMIGDFESEESVYVGSLGSLYKNKTDKIPLYSVDLSEGLNKSVISDTSNPSAQTVSDLKINGHTLIKISGGRNVKYIEGDENIKIELGI